MATDPRAELEAPQWGEYELWEKTEVRLRKRRRWLIAGVVVLFLILSSVPVVMDRAPRWKAYRAARELTQVLTALKTRAAQDGLPYRVRVGADLQLGFERAAAEGVRCDENVPGRWEVVAAEVLPVGLSLGQGIALLPSSNARDQGLDLATDQFCYDPSGAVDLPPGKGHGIGLLTRDDLDSGRFDRLVVLSWQGASAVFTLD